MLGRLASLGLVRGTSAIHGPTQQRYFSLPFSQGIQGEKEQSYRSSSFDFPLCASLMGAVGGATAYSIFNSKANAEEKSNDNNNNNNNNNNNDTNETTQTTFDQLLSPPERPKQPKDFHQGAPFINLQGTPPLGNCFCAPENSSNHPVFYGDPSASSSNCEVQLIFKRNHKIRRRRLASSLAEAIHKNLLGDISEEEWQRMHVAAEMGAIKAQGHNFPIPGSLFYPVFFLHLFQGEIDKEDLFMVGLGSDSYFYTQEMAPPILRCPVGATSGEDSFRPGFGVEGANPSPFPDVSFLAIENRPTLSIYDMGKKKKAVMSASGEVSSLSLYADVYQRMMAMHARLMCEGFLRKEGMKEEFLVLMRQLEACYGMLLQELHAFSGWRDDTFLQDEEIPIEFLDSAGLIYAKNNPKNSDFKLLHYRFFENPGGEASEVPPSSSVKEEVLGNQYMVDDKLVTSVSLAKIDWGLYAHNVLKKGLKKKDDQGRNEWGMGKTMVSIGELEAGREEEIGLKEGEKVAGIEAGDYWCYVKNDQGKEGVVPQQLLVEEVEGLDLRKARQFGAFYMSESGAESEAEEHVNEIQRGDCVVVAHDFTPPAEDPDQKEGSGEKGGEGGEQHPNKKTHILTLKRGDVVRVFENQSSEDWWHGAIVRGAPWGIVHDEIGFFPKSYVTTPANFHKSQTTTRQRKEHLHLQQEEEHEEKKAQAATPPRPKMANFLHSTSQYPGNFESSNGEQRVSKSGTYVFNLHNDENNGASILRPQHLVMLKKFLAFEMNLHPVLRRNLFEHVDNGFIPHYLMTRFVDSDLHTVELELKEIRFVPGSNPSISSLPEEADRQSLISSARYQFLPFKSHHHQEHHHHQHHHQQQHHPQQQMGPIFGAKHLLRELKEINEGRKRRGTLGGGEWRVLKKEVEKKLEEGGVMAGLDAYMAAFEMTLWTGEKVENLDYELATKLADGVVFNPFVWMLMLNDRLDLQLNGLFRRALENGEGKGKRQLRLLAYEGAMWQRANCLPESLTFYLNILSMKPEWGFMVHSCGWALLGLGSPGLAWEYFRLAKEMGVKMREVRELERGVEGIAPDFLA